MSGSYLLDTNAVIAVFAKQVDFAATLGPAADLFFSATSFGELYYGALRSARVASNVARIAGLAAVSAVLASDMGTAMEYGRIKAALAAKGRPIPSNDIWIAALALQHDLTVVTRDAHFQEVSGLTIRAW